MIDVVDERLAAVYGAEALQRLHGSIVAVVGTGLLGGGLCHHLGSCQIGTWLFDDGEVEAVNCANQMFPVAEIGSPKATARARQIAALNPTCPVRVFDMRLEDVGLGVFRDVDLICTALDSRASRIRAREIAQAHGIPWVDAAVDGSGERLLGTVTYYDPRNPASACYSCSYDARRLEEIAREGRGPGCPSWRATDIPLTQPTLVASPFGAVVSGYQMLWATRALLGEASALAGHQLQIAGDGAPRTRIIELARSPQCAFSHAPLGPLQRSSAKTVGELAREASRDFASACSALHTHHRMLATGLACVCGADVELARVREAYTDDDVRCPSGCGRELQPKGLKATLDAVLLGRLAEVSWGDLGLPRSDIVTAEADDGRELHYVVHENAQKRTN